tara:strand:+ start:534 stop:692 length:159 start_codon:yes stop_codon:yes gene_type:complete
METLYKKDIEIYKKEIKRLNKKIDYLEELDRKNFLQIIKLQSIINNYERGIK